MKKNILILLLLFLWMPQFAQDQKPILSGNVTILTGQKMKFQNLRFEENQIVFLNTETKSEFRYFINTIRTIEDAAGKIIYEKKEEIAPNAKPKPKQDWIKGADGLRDKKQIRAEIVFKTGDTLKTHIKVDTNLFDATMLNELSINKTITAVTNDEKIKYSAESVKSLRFVDLSNNERTFVINGKELVELLFDGKIKWCRRYASNSSGNVSSNDFMINKETKQGVGLGGFSNVRKKLREITKSRPDLLPFIENMKINNESILELLKKYDE